MIPKWLSAVVFPLFHFGGTQRSQDISHLTVWILKEQNDIIIPKCYYKTRRTKTHHCGLNSILDKNHILESMFFKHSSNTYIHLVEVLQ